MYELWFRAPYKRLLEEKKLRLAVRPGDRRSGPKAVGENEVVDLRIISLLEKGVVHLGQNARGNPEAIDWQRVQFGFGVANKDYPAQTPHLWNMVYEKLGLETRNVRLVADPDNIETVFAAFRDDPKYIGGDVGVGFKDQAPKHMDELDALAEAIEAINVVVKKGRVLKGYNTDGIGYLASLEAVLKESGEELTRKKIVLLGGGGTTNAIAFALASRDANLFILNRTAEKAAKLSDRLNDFFKKEVARFGGRELIATETRDAHAVVSIIDDPTSPLDQYSALGSIELPPTPERIARNLHEAEAVMASMRPDAIISDVMLRAKGTTTIREARKAGFKTLDGRPMVRNQAIEAFWLVNEPALTEKGVTKEEVANIMQHAA